MGLVDLVHWNSALVLRRSVDSADYDGLHMIFRMDQDRLVIVR
jgi:hypothetical protein